MIRFDWKCYLLLVLWMGLGQISQAQFKDNYTPIVFTGEIPKPVLKSVGAMTESDLSNAVAGKLSARDRKRFLNSTNQFYKALMLSGAVWFEGKLKSYLDAIVDHILRDDPKLRSRIHVYPSRYTSVNAFCMRNGIIIVNIGLIEKMESEAQLAFVLCHEISHFKKRHSLESFAYNTKKSRDESFIRQSDVAQIAARMKFSHKHEYQADQEGMSMFLQTDYLPVAAIASLANLRSLGQDPSIPPIDLSAWLDLTAADSMLTWSREEIKNYEAAHVEAVDTTEMNKRQLRRWRKEERAQEDLGASESQTEEEEELSTHPKIDERIEKIVAQLDTAGRRGAQVAVLPPGRFEFFRTMTRFEQVHQNFRNFRYGRAFYLSLRLLQDYPDNRFLHGAAAMSMYWISYYRSLGTLEIVVLDPGETDDAHYRDLLNVLHNADEDRFTRMAAALLNNLQPENPHVLVATGRFRELCGNQPGAIAAYRAYQAQTKGLEHAVFVKEKLKSLK